MNKDKIIGAESPRDDRSTPIRGLSTMMEALLKQDSLDIEGYISTVHRDIAVPNTRTALHCYFLKLDGHGRPRVNDLARFLSYRILDYVIPRSEIESVFGADATQRSTSGLIELERKAATLFTPVRN